VAEVQGDWQQQAGRVDRPEHEREEPAGHTEPVPLLVRLKMRALEEALTVPRESLVRSLGRRAVKMTRGAILATASRFIRRDASGRALVKRLRAFLETGFGAALTGTVLSVLLEAVPLGSEAFRREIAHELRVEGVSQVYEQLLGSIAEAVLGALDAFEDRRAETSLSGVRDRASGPDEADALHSERDASIPLAAVS
jgi:hypothetical protein